jgi:hypothetical protein
MKNLKYNKTDLIAIKSKIDKIINLVSNNLDKFDLYNYKVYDFFNELYKYSKENNINLSYADVYDYLDMEYYFYEDNLKSGDLLKECKEMQFNRTSKLFLINDVINDWLNAEYNIEEYYNEFTLLLYFLEIYNIKDLKEFENKLKTCDKREIINFIYENICNIDSLKDSIDIFKEKIENIIDARINIEKAKEDVNLLNFLEYLKTNDIEY